MAALLMPLWGHKWVLNMETFSDCLSLVPGILTHIATVMDPYIGYDGHQ